MYFYGVFALSLAMAGRRAALVASATMIAVCGLANLATGASATVVFLRDTHVLEFVSGLVVGALFKSGRLPKSGAVPIAAIAIASLLLQPADLGAEWDWLFLGGPATLLVVSCLAFERRHEIRSRSLLLFGDASYSIYLLHMSVIYDLVLRLMHRVHVWPLNNLGTDATIGAICVVCVIAGVIGYLLVEKPLTSLSRRLYEDIRRCARNAPLAVT
jgi:peptidoglycan/LPS O-acetylase OafA/YrhL